MDCGLLGSGGGGDRPPVYTLGGIVSTNVYLKAMNTEKAYALDPESKWTELWIDEARAELRQQAIDTLREPARLPERFCGRIYAPTKQIAKELVALFTAAGYKFEPTLIIGKPSYASRLK